MEQKTCIICTFLIDSANPETHNIYVCLEDGENRTAYAHPYCADMIYSGKEYKKGINFELKQELPGFRLVPVRTVEQEALKSLSKEMDISEERVFIQALRFYQLCRARGYTKLIEEKERELLHKGK